MGIGTFGSFTQARLAIYAAQTGLNVTGNNISNINTPGYTRQRLDQVSLYTAGSDRYYAEGDIRTGQGALVKSLSQIRSPYLDIRYRTENAKVGYMDAKLDGLNAIAQALDEVGKGDASKDEDGFGVLGLDINKLSSALGDLTDQTGHQEYDNTVRATASNLITKLHSYAGRLEEIQRDTIHDFKQDLKEVNNLLFKIRSLNEEIRKSEIHGDPALELRDDRNNQIDQLSRLIDINVTYSEEEITAGLKVEKLTITLDDANPDQGVTTDEALLVDGVFAAQIELDQIPQENPDLDPAILPFLDANGKPTADETDTPNPDYKPYLNEKGKPTADLSEAQMVDHPNYNLTITELKNKIGDLHLLGKSYALKSILGDAEAKDADGKDTTVAGLFAKTYKNRISITEEDVPAHGDKTITVYTRSQVYNKDGQPVFEADGKTPKYTYTKQVFEQILTTRVSLDDNDLNGELQAERELLTEGGEFTDLQTLADIDEDAAGKRGIPFYQRALDLLANQLATFFNDANQGFRVDPNGNYITTGKNDAGETIAVPVEITAGGKTFQLNKNDTWDKLDPALQAELQAQTKITYTNDPDNLKEIIDTYLKGPDYNPADPSSEAWKETARGIFDGNVLFSNDGDTNDTTNITAANISISRAWKDSPILVRSFVCPEKELEPASGQSDNLLHMQYLLDKEKWSYRPNTLESTQGASGAEMFQGTIFEFWNDIGSTLGQDQNVTGTMLDTYYENALAIDTDRSSVSSVDFNDEAMNLMMYAKSYNAACRLMTTIDSVLDKLINNTGMTT